MAQRKLPPELLQTLIAMSENSGLPLAGEIRLREPALSPFLEQFQSEVGDSLFESTPTGIGLTEIGEMTLDLARQILAANDAMMQVSGAIDDREQIRLGINSMLLDFFVSRPGHTDIEKLTVTSDTCSAIVKAFNERTIDVAMVMDVKDHRCSLGTNVVAEFEMDFAWIRTPEFMLESGKPVPLAAWPADQFIFLYALEGASRAYRLSFTSPDYFAKFAAVKSGKCLTVVPRKTIAPPFIEAKESYLPKIAPKKVLLAVRGDSTSHRFRPIVSALSSLELSSSSDR